MKKYIFSISMLFVSMMCIVAYNIIGCEVLADGTLSEPFFLIPVSYLFGIIAIVSGIIDLISSKIKHRKSEKLI